MLIVAQKHGANRLISTGKLKLCTAGACTTRLDETKWSETRDETPRPFGPRQSRDRDHIPTHLTHRSAEQLDYGHYTSNQWLHALQLAYKLICELPVVR